MNPDDLARILDDIGQRLGPAGEYVFQIAVRQAIIWNAIWVVGWTVLAIFLAVVAGRIYRRKHRLEDALVLIDSRITEANDKASELRGKVRSLESERDAAVSAAMTDEARAAWWTTRFGYSSFGHDRWTIDPDGLKQIRRDNEGRIGMTFALVTAVIACTGLALMGLTPLLNPEYAALTDILSRIVP